MTTIRSLSVNEHDIMVALKAGALQNLDSIIEQLKIASNSATNPEEAKKISDFTHCIIANVKEHSKVIGEQLIQKLHSLLEQKLLFLPREMILEIFLYLSVPELLKIRLWNRFFRNFIDTDPVLQAQITHFALMSNQPKHNISSDQLKLYLQDNKLAVEIDQSLCLWKMNTYFSKELPWISHLIIKNCQPNDLKTLFNHLINSKQLTTLYLCDCEIDQDCCDRFQHLILGINKVRTCAFYFCNVKTPNCKLSEEQRKTIQVVEENKRKTYTVEYFLGNESDRLALKGFEEKVESEDSSSEEVLAYARSLKTHLLLPIISSVWYSMLMDSSSISISQQKMIMQGMDFLKQNPHHMAILAAIRTNQKNYR